MPAETAEVHPRPRAASTGGRVPGDARHRLEVEGPGRERDR